jgi:hypothetical protein
MYKNVITIGLILVCFLLACDSKTVAPDTQSLVGTWLWTKSVGGQTGTETPETCECMREFVFMNGGKYQFYIDYELIESGDYFITTEYDYLLKKDITMLHLKNGATQIVYNDEELRLIPDPRCLSCPDSVYYGRAWCGNN